jgi:hypothetical protein
MKDIPRLRKLASASSQTHTYATLAVAVLPFVSLMEPQSIYNKLFCGLSLSHFHVGL